VIGACVRLPGYTGGMTFPRSSAVLIALGLLAGCRSEAEQASPSPSVVSQTQVAPKDGYRRYGAPITDTQLVELASVLQAPERYTNKTVLVSGEVRRACTRKGCWMELSDAPDKSAPSCRVTFKDYGFFVPTNSAGAHARVQGVVELATLPVSHVEHMESEGAHFARKNPDGTAPEVRLVATGVELKK
jgi:hypothetical protein